MSFKPSSLSQVIGVICLALSSFTPASNAAVLNDSQQVISKTNSEAVRSQQNVDRLAGETRVLLEEYRRVQDSAEYQEVCGYHNVENKIAQFGST